MTRMRPTDITHTCQLHSHTVFQTENMQVQILEINGYSKKMKAFKDSISQPYRNMSTPLGKQKYSF